MTSGMLTEEIQARLWVAVYVARIAPPAVGRPDFDPSGNLWPRGGHNEACKAADLAAHAFAERFKCDGGDIPQKGSQ